MTTEREAIYAVMPEPHHRSAIYGGGLGVPYFTAEQCNAHADATHALRGQQAPALSDGDLERIALACDMLVSHDRETIRSMGHQGGMTLEDWLKCARAVIAAHEGKR